MELIFNLKKCVTKFISNKDFRRIEVIFSARPNAFTISTSAGVLITADTLDTTEGAQIEVAIVAEDFENAVLGYLNEFDGWGLCIALSSTESQMKQLQNYVAKEKYPSQLKIQINDASLINRNLKLDKNDYKIESWSFVI